MCGPALHRAPCGGAGRLTARPKRRPRTKRRAGAQSAHT
jgi:hypothetical protein